LSRITEHSISCKHLPGDIIQSVRQWANMRRPIHSLAQAAKSNHISGYIKIRLPCYLTAGKYDVQILSSQYRRITSTKSPSYCTKNFRQRVSQALWSSYLSHVMVAA